MQRVAKKSYDFADAERWDVQQQVRMTPENRQEAAKKLRERVYGKNPVDVRATVPRP